MQKLTENPRSEATGTKPAVTVVLPGALMTLFPGAPAHVSLEAGTVEELLGELEAQWPGMRDRVRDSRPSIRKHINIFVDGKRATLETRLKAGSKVYVLTAMSGG